MNFILSFQQCSWKVVSIAHCVVVPGILCLPRTVYPQQVDLGVVQPGNSCQNNNLIHLLLQQHVQIVLPVNIRRPSMLTAVAPFVLQGKPKTNLQFLPRLVHFASRVSNLTLCLLHVPIAVPEDFKTKPTYHQ